jgi:hypothetical protein
VNARLVAHLRRQDPTRQQEPVGDPEAAYKIAQGYAALGDRVSALRVLRSSVAGGFFPYPYLRSDPLLEPLRREPELAEILNIAQRRYQAFKDRFF